MTPQFLLSRLRGISGPFRAMCLLLALAFLLGGGARGDIQSLVVLRPCAILLLFYGLARLDRSQIAANRFVLASALLVLLLLGLHLVPLPPGVWGALPGRDLVREIDQVAGLGAVWRSFSLAPDATLNALFAALVPCAALMLGVQLDARERRMLIWPVLLFGGLSALLGIAQLSGPPDGPLYFYRVTNNGAAVGLFSNRNHQALLLATLLPVLAVWAMDRASGGRRSSFRALLAVLAGVAVILLILVTGSRAGLLLGACALLLVPLIALLAALAIWRGRGLAWERLLGTAAGDDIRFAIAPTVLGLIRSYMPLGSGLGSFERVFQMHEPDALLRPNYANHAHNDWLELALTGGIPALLLLAAALVAYAIRGRSLFGPALAGCADLPLARLGMAVVALAAIASLGDYPLRVPSLACFFIVGVLWMSCPLSKNPPFDQPS